MSVKGKAGEDVPTARSSAASTGPSAGDDKSVPPTGDTAGAAARSAPSSAAGKDVPPAKTPTTTAASEATPAKPLVAKDAPSATTDTAKPAVAAPPPAKAIDTKPAETKAPEAKQAETKAPAPKAAAAKAAEAGPKPAPAEPALATAKAAPPPSPAPSESAAATKPTSAPAAPAPAASKPAPAPSTAVSAPAPTTLAPAAVPPSPSPAAAVPPVVPAAPGAPATTPVAASPVPPPPATSTPAATAATPKAKPKPVPAPPPPIGRDRLAPDGDVHGIVTATHRDPFGFLGMHLVQPEGALVVRCFVPEAKAVTLIDAANGQPLMALERVHEDGLFAGSIPGRSKWFAYRLKVEMAAEASEIDDPYRFPPVLADEDVQLLAEGNHLTSHEVLGAHVRTVDGVTGVAFAVWAPNAGRVSVIGEFNNWDGRCHGMRLRHDCGVWEIFLPAVAPGQLYKYEVKSASGTRLPDKCDPYAFQVETRPGSAAIVCELDRFVWNDQAWMKARGTAPAREVPIAIYEVHLPSWRRKPEEGHRPLTYAELAQDLVGYVSYMKFTHIALLPVAEFDADASLGYQTFAPFAPSNRWGDPDGLRMLIDRAHQAGIGIILNWVPTQFTDDPHSLREFDGTHLYEPSDNRRHQPGSSLFTYDYGRREVVNYLLSNALYWFDTFHIDALHIDGVSRMLYLDYGRARGDWQPNRFGGHEYLEAVDFLRRFNSEVYARTPGAFTVCEENSLWPRVSHPAFLGGLGFGFKWQTGWARDILRHLSRNPVHRKYYFDEITQGPATVFNENYVLAVSHDLVAIGQGSLLRRMPGDAWQKFANLRLFYAFLYTHPGKKLLFMGDEFAQEREWNSDISLDWHLAGSEGLHQAMQRMVRDLNALYRTTPALYERDCDADGFSWIDCSDADQGVLAFTRTGAEGKGLVVVACHFTPVVRTAYRIGVPEPGFYEERLNTDAANYGGTNNGNAGGVYADAEPAHDRPYSVSLVLPPFAAVILEYKGDEKPA